MLLKTTLLVCIVAINGLVLAQNTGINQTEKDYLKFKETFQDEIKEIKPDSSIDASKYILHPASLPDWLFTIPPSDKNHFYSLGISDPGMTEEEGDELAEFRAKSMAALLTDPKIASLVDNFSDEAQAGQTDDFVTKYINYYKIDALCKCSNTDFEIIEKFRTSFDESLVLVRYFPNDAVFSNTDSLSIEVEIYQAERQKYNRFELEELYTVSGLFISESDSLKADHHYTFKSLNNLSEIKSEFNGNSLHFPYFNFRYQGQQDTNTLLSENSITTKLNHGLWKGYLEALLQKIVLMAHSSSVTVKQLGDAYTSRTQNLSREVAENSTSLRISCVKIINNQMILNLEYLN
ncbi:MAG: hypothetical protein JW731_11430 [Bacteroidales bacterium]|nr:hypothetical protein [Bacteroidales bacterium]